MGNFLLCFIYETIINMFQVTTQTLPCPGDVLQKDSSYLSIIDDTGGFNIFMFKWLS